MIISKGTPNSCYWCRNLIFISPSVQDYKLHETYGYIHYRCLLYIEQIELRKEIALKEHTEVIIGKDGQEYFKKGDIITWERGQHLYTLDLNNFKWEE